MMVKSYQARAIMVADLIFFHDGFSAHWADVILLDPYVETFQVEYVISITIKFCDFLAVTFFELFQTDDALLDQFVNPVFTWIENASPFLEEFLDAW